MKNREKLDMLYRQYKDEKARAEKELFYYNKVVEEHRNKLMELLGKEDVVSILTDYPDINIDPARVEDKEYLQYTLRVLKEVIGGVEAEAIKILEER